MGESGRQFFSKNQVLTVDRSQLFIVPIDVENPVFEINLPGAEIGLPEGIFVFKPNLDLGEMGIPIQSANQVFFEQQRLAFPLKLRHWQPGDRFKPLGMGGKTKKLSDFFTDNKLARPEKDRVWLLENGDGEIIWVVGMRRAESGSGDLDCSFEFRKNVG